MSRPSAKGTSSQALDVAFANFERLSASTAQRVVRFWQVRQPDGAAGRPFTDEKSMFVMPGQARP